MIIAFLDFEYRLFGIVALPSMIEQTAKDAVRAVHFPGYNRVGDIVHR
ncbi:hypothetical protein SDC9_182938 [bioreactor metagenome]|uniref:Uncharacterized protein n=1 Tax=bioreactor metagenome TaxID=1076179 RepID=A0A645H9Q1_9ZZZZ